MQSIRFEGDHIISKIKEASSPERKRPRKISASGRQRSVSFDTNSEMEVDSAASPSAATPQLAPVLGLSSTNQQQMNQLQPTNPGQQSGPTLRVPHTRGTPQAQQTPRTNQNKQTYATTVSGLPVGLPENQRQRNPPPEIGANRVVVVIIIIIITKVATRK